MNPFAPETLRQLARQHGTPLWVYHADTVRQRIAELRAFDTLRYAQKANANLHLLRLMRAQGVAVDAVSQGEITRALAAGFDARDAEAPGIVYTSDVIDRATLATVIEHAIPVNAGSIDMLHQLGAVSPGHRVWLRINPGFGHGHSRKTNTGGEHSKHGIWHTELDAARHAIQTHRLDLVGVHMHIGSGADAHHLHRVCEAMVDTVARLGLPVRAVSAGGGLPVPYHPSDARIDTRHHHALWHAARRRIEAAQGGRPVRLEIEPGRYLTAECGVLIGEVRAVKGVAGRWFTLLDAGFSELARPALYGGHHEMSLLPSDDTPRRNRPTVVAGPLCESGDVFTQAEGGDVLARDLPEARVGDFMVIHDAGAYGASMSSQYNSRPLAAEVLVDGDQARLIRRRQRMAELLALEEEVG